MGTKSSLGSTVTFVERTDLSAVDPCSAFRELASASLDDELTAAEQDRLDLHLETCVGCRSFVDRSAGLNRRLRVHASTPDPVFVATVMADARPARLGRGGWARPVLAWCALVIFVQSIGPLVFGSADGASEHLARHLGASGLALAVGLAYVAWRPHRAYGLLPFVGALFAATVVAMVADMLAGHRTAFAEATHVAELIGIIVLWIVAGSPGWDEFVSHLPHRRSRRSGALGPTK